MRTIYLFFIIPLFCALIVPRTAAQVPSIQWQKSFGGSMTENLGYSSCIQTSDGGYIVAGSSDSNDGDVGINLGRTDIWILKLDPLGNLQWKKLIGSTEFEILYCIRQTLDGGYIIAASHRNINLLPGNGNHGMMDFYIIKLNSNGDIQLNNQNQPYAVKLGGTDVDLAYSIEQTNDGGYIVVGSSRSSDGDVTFNHGSDDYWIVKLNQSLGVQWQRSYGGSLEDVARSVKQTNDGGYIVAGYSRSFNGDVIGNHGSYDYWILKLDNIGNIIWQNSLGGSDQDYAYSIETTSDNGYIIAGQSNSNNGNVTGNHQQSFDYWVVKLNSVGTLQWQKSLGGRRDDGAFSIKQTCDNGYIVAGYSNSVDFDITNHHGTNIYPDAWIVKLNAVGAIEWEGSFGGTNSDVAVSIQETLDQGLIVGGSSFSSDGDVTQNHGQEDFWIFKLQPTLIGVTANGATTFCKGDSVRLTINHGSNFLWSNGSTSQSIYVKDNGTYFATVDNCYLTENKTVKSNYCSFDLFSKVFIEGYYLGNETMAAVIDPINFPLVCDSILIQLASPNFPYSTLYSCNSIIDIHGNTFSHFNTLPDFDKYYLVFKHRNSLETWSKLPVNINDSLIIFDFR